MSVLRKVDQLDSDQEIFNTLKNVLYPGHDDKVINMILSYCRAKKIDPLLKTLHIVEVSVKTGVDQHGKSIYEKRPTIMPGIASYRIDAHRTGQYAGMEDPEFGPDITEQLGSVKITYPKWCKITGKRQLSNGMIATFSAKEFWKENYALKNKYGNDPTPNDMWQKRPYAQLAKCAEAQMLRKGYPEAIGQEYTHEEMEGKINVIESKVNDIKIQDVPEVKQLTDEWNLENSLNSLSKCLTVEELHSKYKELYGKYEEIQDTESMKSINRKTKEIKELILSVDPDTGEIKQEYNDA